MALTKKDIKKLKDEIKKLESMRGEKGVGFIKKAQINKAIHDRNKLLKGEFKILQAKQQKELNKAKMESAKDKAELAALRRKSLVTEEDIFGKKDLFSI